MKPSRKAIDRARRDFRRGAPRRKAARLEELGRQGQLLPAEFGYPNVVPLKRP